MISKPSSPQAPRRRVLIVDDHPMMREGLARLVNNEPEMMVCGETGTAAGALGMVASVRPHLILVDISLPDQNGLELIKNLQALHPDLPVLVISMHDETLFAERVLRAGGRGYIMKQQGGKELLHAMRQVLAGRIYVSEVISARILEGVAGRRPAPGGSQIEKLTDREFEVFQLLGQGRTTRDIARQLKLSGKTVEVHRLHIKEKLSLQDSTALVRYAVRWVESQKG